MGPEGYPEHLTITQLTELIDVDRHTISNWITAGLITVKRGPGNEVQIPTVGIAEYLPPSGDALMSAAQVMKRAGWSKAQLAYARRKGSLRPVVMPSGTNRYLDSGVTAALRRLAARP